MPELPEVETVRLGLEPVMKGRTIVKAETHREGLRTPFPENLAATLKGRKIASLERRSKYLLLRLDGKKDAEILVLHLGMSGRIRVVKDAAAFKPEKHDHLILRLDNASAMVFNDPRRFGMAFLIKDGERETHPAFRNIGPEPFSKVFTGAVLQESLKKRSSAIKQSLMDQKLVAGIGNIYASEALYEAAISPFRKSSEITLKEAEKLVETIRAVLESALKSGGSSLRDYRRADGSEGYFQHHFAVYDRAGKPCPRCAANGRKSVILKTVQGGRATYYCERCQK
jgi:formamidopyrimidine-DNA glycosylase